MTKMFNIKMTSLMIISILVLASLAKFTTYDETLSKELSALAFAAICPREALTNWDVGYVSRNYPNVEHVNVFYNIGQGTFGYIAFNKNRNAITIAFRGSENVANAIENLETNKVKFNDECGCKVHRGFKNAYLSIEYYIPLDQYLQEYPGAQIHVIGHSLGGAIATLTAANIAITGKSVFLYTIGSPRVGDAAFYQYFGKLDITHYRIVNEKDRIPHLPWHNLAFRHVEREIWYHDGGYTICNADKDEDHNCSYSVKNTSNSDHNIYLGWSSEVDCWPSD